MCSFATYATKTIHELKLNHADLFDIHDIHAGVRYNKSRTNSQTLNDL